MTMRNTTLALISLTALTVLAGCISGPSERRSGPSVAAVPSGVEGAWVDTDGVGVSTFAGGSFSTVAADTGSKLSEGTYRVNDPRSVSIEVRSIIRGTVNNVSCALANPSQLNCTSSAGNRFVLVRRSATS